MANKIYHPIRKRDCKTWSRRIERLLNIDQTPRVLLVPALDDQVFGLYNPAEKHIVIYTPAGLSLSTLAHEYIHHEYFINFERRNATESIYPVKWHTITFFSRLIELHASIEHHYKTRVAIPYPPAEGRWSMERAIARMNRERAKRYLSRYMSQER